MTGEGVTADSIRSFLRLRQKKKEVDTGDEN